MAAKTEFTVRTQYPVPTKCTYTPDYEIIYNGIVGHIWTQWEHRTGSRVHIGKRFHPSSATRKEITQGA